MTSSVRCLQSSKIPRNNHRFISHVLSRTQKSAKASPCRLSSGKIRLGLCFSQLKKRHLARIWGSSAFTWIFIRLTFPSTPWGMQNLQHLKYSFTMSLPTRPTSFYSQIQWCLKHPSKLQGLVGVSKVGFFHNLYLATHSTNVYGATPICQASGCG